MAQMNCSDCRYLRVEENIYPYFCKKNKFRMAKPFTEQYVCNKYTEKPWIRRLLEHKRCTKND